MKRSHRKSLVLLIAAALLLTIGVSGTVAYFSGSTRVMTQTFSFARVDTELVENSDGSGTTGIAVRNGQAEDNIPVYVRVALTANWVDAEGRVVAPWTGSIRHDAVHWEKKDGFYYCRAALPAGETTPNLLASPITQEGRPDGADHLMITAVHQSVQAMGRTDAGVLAVTDAWGWTPPDGKEGQK